MQYMVIERFKEGATPQIYARLRERGRLMPDGLKYVGSWITQDLKTCWQVMETSDAALFEKWTAAWGDLMEFEIIPVHSSAEVVQLMSAGPH